MDEYSVDRSGIIKKFKPYFVLFLIILAGCTEEFVPETTEKKSLLIVEGLITDQYETYEIKLSRSQPLGLSYQEDPVAGAQVTVMDDLGRRYFFHEKSHGVYLSDSTVFKGETGRKYSLHINAPDTLGLYSYYESAPVELKPVPPIDSLYYEKITVREADNVSAGIENCQIYLDSHDDTGNCKYFRWDFTETWQFHLHWDLPNYTCWISENSRRILVKNTSGLVKNDIIGFPINYIPETSDRLVVKYSMMANQYSLSQDEYTYWESLKHVTEDVGGLYDMTPANIPGNIVSISHPDEQVLGYFSVSAKTSRRIFIKDYFAGQVNIYKDCVSQTIYNPPDFIAGIGTWLWILYANSFASPPVIILTDNQGCADCTVRGSGIKPDFWDNE
jgi:hypothetical protein